MSDPNAGSASSERWVERARDWTPVVFSVVAASSEVIETPWRWEARPDVWVLMAAIGATYWWVTTRLRPRLDGPPAAPSRSMVLRFGVGLLLLWIAVDWPMDRLGDDFLFSAHMAQFVLITMIAVPLMIVGIPGWVLAELTAPARPQLQVLCKPPIALGIFQITLVVTHLPPVVALYTSSSLVHFGLHALWIGAAGLFWQPIIGNQPFATPLKHGSRVVYLIAATVIPTVPASFLTWATTPIYDSYAEAPRVWGLGPIEDLQLAGIIMKLGGGFILWGVIAWTFLSWASQEHQRNSGCPVGQ